MSVPLVRILRVTALFGVALVAGCGQGGSGGTFDARGTLLAVHFPDARRPGAPDVEAPLAAPLVQRIVYEFSARPDPARIPERVLAPKDSSGVPAPGHVRVDGRFAVFTPRLPLEPLRALGPDRYDVGGAGLEPDEPYAVELALADLRPFLTGIDESLRVRFPDRSDPSALRIPLHTTADPAEFFAGLEERRPAVVAVSPTDGSADLAPGLYTDPDGRFRSFAPFRIEFDAPLDPGEDNLAALTLFDLDDTVQPGGLELGAVRRLLVNEVDRSVVEVRPSGILPFGHLLSLEAGAALRGLSGSPDSGDGSTLLASYTVAKVAADEVVADELREGFDDTLHEDAAAASVPLGSVRAEWNEADSQVLLAGFSFRGTGELGRFLPHPSGDPDLPHRVGLDTDHQALPLLDGSTPDAPAGTEVRDGVFSFTDVIVPDGVVLEVRGSQPLVLAATGTVRIAGRIEIFAQNGNSDSAFDSGVFSVAGGQGGAGGGRGGEGQPLIYLGGEVNLKALVSPRFGGHGFGPSSRERIGGRGGECGILDNADANGEYGTDMESNCNEISELHNNGWKAPGGGGGSMRFEGEKHNRWGIGNVVPDGFGGWVVRTKEDGGRWDELEPGAGGDPPFSNADPDDDFVGTRGEYRQVFGGQGGGAGGSVSDAYYCGAWCQLDSDPTNDGLCLAEFGFPPAYGDSVGDSRGGAGGGGGGALEVQALGPLIVEGTAVIDAHGGNGGCGEALSCSNYGGCGGGGSGGTVSLESPHSVLVRSGARIDVSGGRGGWAYGGTELLLSCPGGKETNRGSGGDASIGLIQLRVPIGQTAVVEAGADLTPDAWVDPTNTRNPSDVSSTSVATSTWYDLGRTIERAPDGPSPQFTFHGLDGAGYVETDAQGEQLDPSTADVRCDFLGVLDPDGSGRYQSGLEPRAWWIPPNASVRLEFQAADAIAPGSKEVDPDTVGAWSPDVTVADGHQFLRWRTWFDIADGVPLDPAAPRPAVQFVRVRAGL